ncbi:MAG: Na+/H+ antiporter subunit G [Alphaproteobacteria bacterium]
MELIAEIVVSALIVSGGVFALVGSYGLVKLPELMTRLHAPTKATSLGVGSILIASMVYFAVFAGDLSIHELLITLFLLLTAPITANFIAKTYMHRHRDRVGDLPPPAAPCHDWATYAPPSEPRPRG